MKTRYSVTHNDLSIAVCAATGVPVAACAVELGADGAPKWIEILRAGSIEARDGRAWSMPDPDAVLAATRERWGATDIVVDYEHQTINAAHNGQAAPAAGWIRELEVRNGAIWGRVEWTERAASAIEAKEYRYFSPVFAHDEDGTVQALINGALTNNPALDLTALASFQIGDISMTLKQFLASLAAVFGLSANADADAVTAAAKALVAGRKAVCEALGVAEDTATETLVAALKARETARVALAKALGKTASATDEELLAAAKAKAPAPGDFVPMSEFQAVSTRLKTLEDATTESAATDAVDAAIAAGKITPAQRDWALNYAKSDADGFKNYVESAPVIVQPGPGRTSSTPPTSADAPLTADEKAVCKLMNISEDNFKKSRKQYLERAAA